VLLHLYHVNLIALLMMMMTTGEGIRHRGLTLLAVCSCAELHDAIFVVGALDEMLMLRGMRYHPIDIENSIVRSHRNICEWSVSLLLLSTGGIVREIRHSGYI